MRPPPFIRTTGFRRIAAVLALGLVMLVSWRAYQRRICRIASAKFEEIQHSYHRDDVHKLLGTPNQVFTGADVLSKLHWGANVVGTNDGQVVRDERYTPGGVWCSSFIVIGYADDGSVQSKFIYE